MLRATLAMAVIANTNTQVIANLPKSDSTTLLLPLLMQSINTESMAITRARAEMYFIKLRFMKGSRRHCPNPFGVKLVGYLLVRFVREVVFLAFCSFGATSGALSSF